MIQKLEDDYAMDRKKAQQVVMLWCDSYGVGILGKKNTISLPSQSDSPIQASPSVSHFMPNTASSGIQWRSNRTISVAPPRYPKKLTGTRLPDVLGMNPFKTPFEVWCAVTKTYEEPFVDNKYTKAGKVIEPKQFTYACSQIPGRGLTFASPTDVYGSDYFKKTYGDFFKTT